ncbi:MAG: hypothetical protein WC916_06260 [Candidatus Woesearchaeota archaeon]
MDDEAKIKFKKIFANLPSKIRQDDIIVVIENKPYNWNAAYFEINNNTPDGKKILEKLLEMKII